MSNFKYSANINGSIENKKRFVQDLEIRGYKWNNDSLKYYNTLCVNAGVNATNKNLLNGFYRSGESPVGRDYIFNIDTEQEYNTALAILSMKDDELFSIGELVEILAAGGWGYNLENNGCIGIVLEVENLSTPSKDYPKNGSTQNITFKTLNPRLGHNYKIDKANAPNLACDKPVFRKLTAQEVINFYKTSSTQEKKLIGYKIIKQYPGLHSKFVGETVLSPLYKLSDGTYVAGQVFEKESKYYSEDLIKEFFEPVYEDLKPVSTKYTLESGFTILIHKTGEVCTNDGDFTIKELDTKFGICFRSTKFNKWDMVVTQAKYKIGCQVVTHKDIIGIEKAYQELNK